MQNLQQTIVSLPPYYSRRGKKERNERKENLISLFSSYCLFVTVESSRFESGLTVSASICIDLLPSTGCCWRAGTSSLDASCYLKSSDGNERKGKEEKRKRLGSVTTGRKGHAKRRNGIFDWGFYVERRWEMSVICLLTRVLLKTGNALAGWWADEDGRIASQYIDRRRRRRNKETKNLAAKKERRINGIFDVDWPCPTIHSAFLFRLCVCIWACGERGSTHSAFTRWLLHFSIKSTSDQGNRKSILLLLLLLSTKRLFSHLNELNWA